MALELKQHCTFSGPALPEPFVQFELEKELNKEGLLPKSTGQEGQALQESWEVYQRKLRELVSIGGAIRVKNHVIDPLAQRLGYEQIEAASEVKTREEWETGGYLLTVGDAKLRVWCTDFNADLDAPAKRGAAYRYSPLRIAQRVLLTCGERLGLLTNGVELRLLISDPARPDSQITIAIDPNWKRSRTVPDSYRLVLALATPAGIQALPKLVDKARLQQAKVTKDLRLQARRAVEALIQGVLEHPTNREALKEFGDREALAKQLWREGLITVYRLLFVLKLESSDDPARSFSFASTSLWRNSFSPSVALAHYVRKVLDDGAETGSFLEDGLRSLFRMFTEGVQCTELNVKPLGGALFGAGATPILTRLQWGERSVALLLDQLLWTTANRRGMSRERVHYGALDVEDLGRVYEALLELEPGISHEPMCRLRRQKLEVVVPIAQGEKYRPAKPKPVEEVIEDEIEDEEDEEEESPKSGKKTKVEWIEEIPPNRFYLRVGLGRKASGSYYTPHSFVRFLVQETLGAQVAECSPKDDPNPIAILKLKVLDPAMGSGHFLVEACRFLGEKLYEACRSCDEKATAAEKRYERSRNEADRAEAEKFRRRVIELPDPDDKLTKYLPSAAPEGKESGLSQTEAISLCRRLVAVHCLYGVDKNPLAVELAKLSLWIESHAEGLPLTFLDHRLVLGDSLTGAFFEHLLKYPGSQDEIDELLYRGIRVQFTEAMADALRHVRDLEASVGVDVAELEAKRAAKARLDRALAPFKVVAAAWSGGVMLGGQCDDVAYGGLIEAIGKTGDLPSEIGQRSLLEMIAKGLGVDVSRLEGERSGFELEDLSSEVQESSSEVENSSFEVQGSSSKVEDLSSEAQARPVKRKQLLKLLESPDCVPAFPFDLVFAEVFYPDGNFATRQGFDVILGNPPWNKTNLEMSEFMGSIDLRFLEAGNSQKEELVKEYEGTSAWNRWIDAAKEEDRLNRAISVLHPSTQSETAGFGAGHSDIFAPFVDCCFRWLKLKGILGLVLPTAFHVSHSLSRLRRKFLHGMTVGGYFSFENKRSLFEIDKRWKFSILVAKNTSPSIDHGFLAQFYLHHDQWLFSDDRKPKPFLYSAELIEKMDPDNLIFQEFTSNEDAYCADTVFLHSIAWKDFSENNNWQIRRELNATEDRWRIDYKRKDVGRSWNRDISVIVNHLPGTIHQFTDLWEGAETAAIPIENLADKPAILELTRYYRAAYRITARATDERTSIYTILCPGTTATNKLPIEGTPTQRPNSLAIGAIAVCNSFVFDWCLRLRVGSKDVSKFIVNVTPMSEVAAKSILCVHSALRLTCNHSGYAPLWREQLADAWREPNLDPFTFPILATPDDRWSLRAVIDAVVAQAYGLDRTQYAHILSTFSHKSYLQAPHLCLDRFDELLSIGLESFTQKYDPYYDIPLNESLPKPVIDLPIPETISPQQQSLDLNIEPSIPTKKRRKKS